MFDTMASACDLNDESRDEKDEAEDDGAATAAVAISPATRSNALKKQERISGIYLLIYLHITTTSNATRISEEETKKEEIKRKSRWQQSRHILLERTEETKCQQQKKKKEKKKKQTNKHKASQDQFSVMRARGRSRDSPVLCRMQIS